MQDIIILGYLMQDDRTGYEVKKLMETSTNYFFNTSLGCIFPAFSKLEKNKLVTSKRTMENGRSKKKYSITPLGKKAFIAWMNNETVIAKLKEEVLLKIFFFTELASEERESSLRDYLEKLDAFVGYLIELRASIIKTMPDYDYFRMTVLEFGIDYYSFIKKWFGDYLKNSGCRPEKNRGR